MWRGGRDFKDPGTNPPKKSAFDGASDDTIMIDESSDGEPVETTKDEEPPEFRDDELKDDPAKKYEAIIQVWDISLDVEVLHLAFPLLPPDLHRSSLPPILTTKVLVAVACSDSSIRVISLPLLPPSPQRKAQRVSLSKSTATTSRFGEQIIVLSNGTTHQGIPKGVSISMTAAEAEDSEDVNMEEDDIDSTNRLPLSRHSSRSRSHPRSLHNHEWYILVASHSADISGLLLIHKIPLAADGNNISSNAHMPWQKQYLVSPAVSVNFSSALYPDSRHCQLLVAEAKGAIRVFDCLSDGQAAQEPWLLSFYTDFESSETFLAKRKPILGARWVLGGKAILALQGDGKWAVWDYEGAGPKPTDANNKARPTSGGNFIKSAMHGWVGDSLKSKPLLKSSNAKKEGRSKLAPMTPSTRKMRQDAFYTGPTTIPDGPLRGGLSVCPVHDKYSSRLDDESVLLWYGKDIVVIPSFVTHWQNKVRGSGNLFGSGAKGEPRTISNIQLGGELCTEVELIPSRPGTGSATKPSNQMDVLVTGEKRLLIVSLPLTASKSSAATIPRKPTPAVDQQLLAKGDLDVDGMDRILADMSNDHTHKNSSQFSKGSTRNLLSL